jgi:hypothetical protein
MRMRQRRCRRLLPKPDPYEGWVIARDGVSGILTIFQSEEGMKYCNIVQGRNFEVVRPATVAEIDTFYQYHLDIIRKEMTEYDALPPNMRDWIKEHGRR